MENDLFNSIRQQYSKYASWAVWDDSNEKDTKIIDANIDILHSHVIILALNISDALTSEWSNFRGGKHDRKLRKALNHSSYRGAYITDYCKDTIQANSKVLIDKLKSNSEEIECQTRSLFDELRNVGATSDSLLIIMGGKSTYLYSLYMKNLQSSFPKHICHYHYSYYGLTDEDWLEQLWLKLEGVDPTFVRPEPLK